MRVRREDQAFVKRRYHSSTTSIRLGYLSALEVSKYTRALSTKFRLEKLYYWHARTRIVQLKAKRPTIRESAMNAFTNYNLIKFCNNIISAHRIGAFGGKEALWDFFKDVGANPNRKDSRNCYSENSKYFAQAMRIYEGSRLCDLFSFNFVGSNYDSIRREGRKEVAFISSEHADIFKSIVAIHVNAKAALVICTPIPIILVEDETKVRGHVS